MANLIEDRDRACGAEASDDRKTENRACAGPPETSEGDKAGCGRDRGRPLRRQDDHCDSAPPKRDEDAGEQPGRVSSGQQRRSEDRRLVDDRYRESRLCECAERRRSAVTVLPSGRAIRLSADSDRRRRSRRFMAPSGTRPENKAIASAAPEARIAGVTVLWGANSSVTTNVPLRCRVTYQPFAYPSISLGGPSERPSGPVALQLHSGSRRGRARTLRGTLDLESRRGRRRSDDATLGAGVAASRGRR